MTELFKFFEPEYFKPILGRTDCKQENLACSIANGRLNMKGVRVVGSTNGLWTNPILRDDYSGQKEEALLICPRPIKKQEPKCNHVIANPFDFSDIKIVKWIKESRCPRCDKELTENQSE